jgi:hypothetical protein
MTILLVGHFSGIDGVSSAGPRFPRRNSERCTTNELILEHVGEPSLC